MGAPQTDIQSQQRLGQLEDAMDALVREHMVVDSLEDAARLVPQYISCETPSELEYCREYLRAKCYSGKLSYALLSPSTIVQGDHNVLSISFHHH